MSIFFARGFNIHKQNEYIERKQNKHRERESEETHELLFPTVAEEEQRTSSDRDDVAPVERRSNVEPTEELVEQQHRHSTRTVDRPVAVGIEMHVVD